MSSSESSSVRKQNKQSIFLPPSQTRLVTIAAHVDHGKTTLADNLIERNGIISERMAGTVRYLDSDPEEQRRGITIRSSAIGLKHTLKATAGGGGKNGSSNTTDTPMLIHLLDSPGHSDFQLEVTSALAACDSCLLVVDAIEGMCARTHQVFREAYANQLTPVLVVNKLDRLCTDLCLTPTEAYLRLRNLLENVNAAASAMLTSAQYGPAVSSAQSQAQKNGKDTNNNSSDSNNGPPPQEQTQEELEQERAWTFEPVYGNVIFASALFGWGFTVQSLARCLFRSKTVPIKPLILKQCLFGDYKLSSDNTKVLKWKQQSGTTTDASQPVFAEYALQPIWDIYQGVATAASVAGLGSSIFADGRGDSAGSGTGDNNTNNNNSKAKIQGDTTGMDSVLAALQAGATSASEIMPTTVAEIQTLLARTGANTEEAVLRMILRRYRPLAESVLDTVCEYCPSPVAAAQHVRSRVLSLQTPSLSSASSESAPAVAVSPELARIRQAVSQCDASPDAPCVAHVCKFIATDRIHIRDPDLPAAADTDADAADDSFKQNSNLILGLARVLSGVLRTGQEYYLMGPKHTSAEASPAPKRVIRLYLLMGSSFVHVNEVPAGHLCAVYNLEDIQLKTMTLSDSIECMPMRGLDRGIRPLVKVNVEPEDPSEADALERGLVKLSLADAAVEVTATAKGERILACLGELHLEQSILDLEKVYCGKEMKLRISDPIVDFGETTDWFEGEVDYTAFYDSVQPPLRQTIIPPYNEEEGLAYAKRGRTRAVLSGRCAAISLRVIPLAASVHKSMSERKVIGGSEEELLEIGRALRLHSESSKMTAAAVLDVLCESLCSLDTHGNALVESPNLTSGYCIQGVESELGEIHVPRVSTTAKSESSLEDDPSMSTGMDEYETLRSRIRLGGIKDKKTSKAARSVADQAAQNLWTNELRGSAVAGFQLAVRSGPVCEEPVRGVMVVLEGVEIAVSKQRDSYQPAKPLSGGMVVAVLRSGIRCGLLSRPVRLTEGHLRLTLHSSLAGLGALYHVLNKRRGAVLDDSMVDGTDLLMITANIPQAEAFGLAPELFGKTSGEVTAPEMVFSHWERLDADPFWIPTSAEEREDFGEVQTTGDSSTGLDNTALHYIRKVRERKGLVVDSARTVTGADKQRTLKR